MALNPLNTSNLEQLATVEGVNSSLTSAVARFGAILVKLKVASGTCPCLIYTLCLGRPLANVDEPHWQNNGLLVSEGHRPSPIYTLIRFN